MKAMPEETLFFFDFDVFAIVLKPLLKFPGFGCRQSPSQADGVDFSLEDVVTTADP